MEKTNPGVIWAGSTKKWEELREKKIKELKQTNGSSQYPPPLKATKKVKVDWDISTDLFTEFGSMEKDMQKFLVENTTNVREIESSREDIEKESQEEIKRESDTIDEIKEIQDEDTEDPMAVEERKEDNVVIKREPVQSANNSEDDKEINKNNNNSDIEDMTIDNNSNGITIEEKVEEKEEIEKEEEERIEDKVIKDEIIEVEQKMEEITVNETNKDDDSQNSYPDLPNFIKVSKKRQEKQGENKDNKSELQKETNNNAKPEKEKEKENESHDEFINMEMELPTQNKSFSRLKKKSDKNTKEDDVITLDSDKDTKSNAPKTKDTPKKKVIKKKKLAKNPFIETQASVKESDSESDDSEAITLEEEAEREQNGELQNESSKKDKNDKKKKKRKKSDEESQSLSDEDDEEQNEYDMNDKFLVEDHVSDPEDESENELINAPNQEEEFDIAMRRHRELLKKKGILKDPEDGPVYRRDDDDDEDLDGFVVKDDVSDTDEERASRTDRIVVQNQIDNKKMNDSIQQNIKKARELKDDVSTKLQRHSKLMDITFIQKNYCQKILNANISDNRFMYPTLLREIESEVDFSVTQDDFINTVKYIFSVAINTLVPQTNDALIAEMLKDKTIQTETLKIKTMIDDFHTETYKTVKEFMSNTAEVAQGLKGNKETSRKYMNPMHEIIPALLSTVSINFYESEMTDLPEEKAKYCCLTGKRIMPGEIYDILHLFLITQIKNTVKQNRFYALSKLKTSDENKELEDYHRKCILAIWNYRTFSNIISSKISVWKDDKFKKYQDKNNSDFMNNKIVESFCSDKEILKDLTLQLVLTKNVLFSILKSLRGN